MSWRCTRKGSNPDLLTEVTYGELGFAPMMEKSGTGRMSPVRGRTMKEYDQQITELQKANFNLKLRIYFLEERMNMKSGEEDVIKYNIELKVEVERFKQEMKEKQDLLDKASETINNITATFSDELERQLLKSKGEHEDKLDGANKRVGELEDQLHMLEESLKQSEDKYAEDQQELAEMKADVGDKDRLLEELQEKVKKYEDDLKSLTLSSAERERDLENKIDHLMSNVDRRDQDIQKLSLMVQDEIPRESISLAEKNRLQDELEGKGRKLDRLEMELKNSSQLIEAHKASENQGLQKELRMKNVIKGTMQQIVELKSQIDELQKTVESQEQELKHLRQQLADVCNEKDKALNELQGLKHAIQKEEEKNGDYENELENLTRSLGKKQGELDHFQELLRRAQTSLEMSEAAVLSLEKQLERERCRCKNKKSESDEVIQMRQELDDLHKQLEDQDQAYNAKCQQLDDLHKQLEDQDHAYNAKCKELDAVARKLNITVNNQAAPTASPSAGSKADNSDQLQKILDELNVLKGAVQADRHVHIDINSHSSMEQPNQSPMDLPSLQKMLRIYGLVDEKTPGSPPSHGQHSFNHAPVHSKIPVRRSSANTTPPEVGDLRRQLVELTARNLDLQTKLEATEENVHCQTRKMNSYKNMLAQNGILPRSRSNSESNVSRLSQERDGNFATGTLGERRVSMENLHKRGRSLSPTLVDRQGYIADVGEGLTKLSKENIELKQQVEAYKRLLKVFKDRSPSPGSDSLESGQDGGSEHATCVLEGYLDTLDKFLVELADGDQNEQGSTYTGNENVTCLRRGLVQARGAIQSLSEAMMANKQGEGRMSPDSGCSDNFATTQGTSLKSHLVSPTHSHSASISPRGQRLSATGYREGGDSQVFAADVPYRSRTSQEPDTMGSYPDGDTGYGSQFHTDRTAGFQHTASNRTSGSQYNTSDRTAGSQYNTSDRTAGSQYNGSDRTAGSQYNTFDRTAGSCAGNGLSTEAGSKFNSDDNLMDFSHDQYTLPQTSSQSNHVFPCVMENSQLKTQNQDNDFAQPAARTPYKVVNMPLERLKGRHFKMSKPLSPLRAEGDRSATSGRDVFDMTLRQSFYQQNPDESCMNQTLDESRRNTANLKARITSLEDMITSYEKQIRARSTPDMDLLHQHLKELRQLRLELERSNRHNELLEQELLDFRTYSEATIEDLQQQLQEVTNQLTQCRHVSDQNLSTANERVEEFKHKFENSRTEILQYKLKLDKANAEIEECKACKTEIIQYKLKLDKANAEIEECKLCCVESVDHMKGTLEQYKTKLSDANLAYDKLQRECDDRIERVNVKVEQCLKECKEKLNNMNAALERCKRTCEQKVGQCKSACEETVVQCRQACEEKEERANAMLGEYKQLLEEQRLKSTDYKRQIERQNQLVKDMKDRAEKMRQELEHASKSREIHEKQIAERTRELQECTKLRDRYKNNLTVVHTEMKRTKVLLREKEKDLEMSGMLNSSRLLDISQKLESGADRMTDDDKQSIIAQLLEELMHVREQMKKLLEQNNSIKQKMTELLKELREQKKRPNDPTSQSDGKFELENYNKLDDSSSNRSYSSFTGSPRTAESPLGSHPLRDITLGARNSMNADSWSGSPLQSADKSRDKSRSSSNSQESLSLSHYIMRSNTASMNNELTSSKESLDTDSSRSDGHPGSGPHFSVPGPIYKQGITDSCLVYRVNDAPELLAGLTKVKIDSDLRSLFAIGMIDKFEKLKEETNESRAQLANLCTRVAERLRILSRMSATEMIKSPEYSTLKEISYTTDNLRICAESQHSMLQSFWTSELPAPNERGEFVNQKLLDENSSLKERLTIVTEKYDRLTTHSSHEVLRNDDQICKYLSNTLDTMTRAKHNLQHTRHQSWGSQGSPSKSPRK